MDQAKGSVLLVTDANPQSQLFIDYIHQQLQCPVAVKGLHENHELHEEETTLVLMDADHVDDETLQQWYYHTLEGSDMYLAAFNLRDEDHAADVLAKFHLQGVFYRSDSLMLICKGISKLLEGDLWISRSLMTRLIDFYRRQQRNAYRPICGLTHRELEIIGLLGSGASNSEIAERLFVSEHTVKSHLYNVFRKIKVHNRIQAMNWARQNLGAMPINLATKVDDDNHSSIRH
ncbi:LuxR C-terminal-related transcriptional regulator [Aidingimonas lacisalsi]|uniref:LuxR C-terminal-related transcriptional regulator n=1 Tax=Aidingimonas lacisalsi TaxID=2604086 RepID=UPI0011D1E491|nr:LuxR C-terminal-related transcriptional regulator [Aidingimonas lacisalsi]